MSDNSHADDGKTQSAAITQISLSQALLAPLDAIFKAQIHSARSFVNFLLQLGYHHQKVDENGQPIKGEKDGKPFYLEFVNEITEEDGSQRKQRISVPALAAIPISPLSVESAEFDFAMNVESLHRHSQVQPSRDEGLKEVNRHKRPWFLVDQPVSVRGTIASDEQSSNHSTSAIRISVKVGPAKVPAGLNKFITSLGELSDIQDLPPDNNNDENKAAEKDATT